MKFEICFRNVTAISNVMHSYNYAESVLICFCKKPTVKALLEQCFLVLRCCLVCFGHVCDVCIWQFFRRLLLTPVLMGEGAYKSGEDAYKLQSLLFCIYYVKLEIWDLTESVSEGFPIYSCIDLL